jgi:hypothetical protein
MLFKLSIRSGMWKTPRRLLPMRSRRSRTSLRIALSAAAVCSAIAGGRADAKGPPTPLDLPPKLYTFKLDDAAGHNLSLLRGYLDASVERPGPYSRYVGGAYGRWYKEPLFSLAWAGTNPPQPSLGGELPPLPADGSTSVAGEGSTSVPEESNEGHPIQALVAIGRDPAAVFGFDAPEAEPLRVRMPADDWVTRLFVASEPPFWTTGPSLAGNGFDALWAAPAKPVVDWRCRRRPVSFVRLGGQSDRFALVRCNGAVETGAVERLSIVARPPNAPDPGELPDEPDPEAWEKGEWMPQVKLVHPRLVWLLQKIADAFPHRAISIYSGYRPHREKAGGQGHHSLHGDGRAMDIQVYGVRNESLFQFCRKLDDVGCGYYPNSKFVHVDIRRPGTGHAFWIDVSGPGEPPRYVDSWPGVVESGALAWVQLPQKHGAQQGRRAQDERGTADVIRK